MENPNQLPDPRNPLPNINEPMQPVEENNNDASIVDQNYVLIQRPAINAPVPLEQLQLRIEVTFAQYVYRNPEDERPQHDTPNCSICISSFLDGQDVRRITCGHIYHTGCIDHWLAIRTNCPVCRVNVEL